ncbi:MAG: hypothetical protein K9M98_10310 [Cephaloticoccus sp.]|nr:hypothetical protein [Cephaloticoccus sp.]MCF7760884.1 hypothetical protein [Cephaloticoccus sp.]
MQERLAAEKSMAERVGFEPTHPLRQDIDFKESCESGEAQSSPLASPIEGKFSPELEKIVQAWDTLRPELKAAISAIIESTK